MIFFPNELKKSINKRRAEYLAGRILARKLLLEFGIKNKIIVSNHHRCPIWPRNIVGSISHSSSIAICIMAKSSEYSGLGVDIEKVFSQTTTSQIKSLVFDSNEWNKLRCSGIPIELAGTIGFSAKESLFKALYPSVGNYFDFSSATISQLDMENGELELELTSSLNSFLLKNMKFKIKIENEQGEILAELEMQENVEIDLDIGEKNVIISNEVKNGNTTTITK